MIGTGASAVQFIPAIQPEVPHLTVFQRTPAWVMPRHDRSISSKRRFLMRALPVLQRLERLRLYLVRERILVAFRLGCKRVLVSDDYLATLDQPNVALVTDRIREIDGDGIIDVTGAHHAVDVIIFGTGFRTSRLPLTDRMYGRDGRSMAEAWGGNPTTPAAQSAFTAEVDRLSEGTVWTSGGCKSWYLNENGRNVNIWPGSTLGFRRRTMRFEASQHVLQRTNAPAPVL